MKKPTKINRKIFNEHDKTWNMFYEIERLKIELDNSIDIESRFVQATKRKLAVKEKKLNRYLTPPSKKAALEWQDQVYKAYLNKNDIQKMNLKLLISDLMFEISKLTNADFPVQEQEVIRYLATMGIRKTNKLK